MRKFIREVTLNDKFRGTWVAEGLNDESTKTSFASKLKQPDFVDELLNAGVKADDWFA